jgi:hypothetical protein
MTSQEIVAEIVAIIDREDVPSIAVPLILTEVAGLEGARVLPRVGQRETFLP